MKEKYKVKRICGHCKHEFEFWNTLKFSEEIEKINLWGCIIKKKWWTVECPNCGSEVTFKTEILDL